LWRHVGGCYSTMMTDSGIDWTYRVGVVVVGESQLAMALLHRIDSDAPTMNHFAQG